jgi:hypothetical protein
MFLDFKCLETASTNSSRNHSLKSVHPSNLTYVHDSRLARMKNLSFKSPYKMSLSQKREVNVCHLHYCRQQLSASLL